jgi:uncharacterized membrane protein YfcA
MDWLYILMPIAGVKIFWPGLIILGVGVGIIGGFFGMGGAWMVTPGLNILGFPMAFAIGTDIAHMAGKSLISTMRHGKFGNVDYKLGMIMLAGTVVGFEVGAQMVMWLERIGSVEKVVRWLYIGLLAALPGWSSMMWPNAPKKRRPPPPRAKSWKPAPPVSSGTRPCTKSRSRRWCTSRKPASTAAPGCRSSSASSPAGWPVSSASAAV